MGGNLFHVIGKKILVMALSGLYNVKERQKNKGEKDARFKSYQNRKN